MKRYEFLALGALAALPLLMGCPNNTKNPETPAGTGTANGTTIVPGQNPGKKRPLKAGLVTDVGGIDDRSFNASAWAGLQKAEKDLGAQVKYVESRQSADYVPNLTRFAKDNYDVVFAVGTMMKDAVREVAEKSPTVRFVLIDGDDLGLPNVVSYRFREEEGSFLVGALAAKMSKTGVLGFVGGMQMPLIEKFQFGFQAGAETANPNVSVLVGYAGKFNDPAKGQEIAISQMNGRADIVYHAAGGTGIGVIKAVAAKGKGYYAIGVDQDQDDVAPGRVLTSMVKRVDRAVLDAANKVNNDEFERGEVVWGLKEDGIGLSEMKHTKNEIPAGTLKEIEDLKQKIIDKKIIIPVTLRDYEDFSKRKPDADAQ
ncbi:MAG: BMP family ABC transporter substrate-binding protein [Armatimonas sp.]